MRSESACGCGLVLGLIALLVTATRHMTAKIAGHVNEAVRSTLFYAIHVEAILALVCLLGLMWGDGGVVQRSRRTCFPVPPAVLAALQAGSSLDHFQNIIEGDSSYCVRCCVWRRTSEGKPTSSCRRVFLRDNGSEYNFHHCSVCQRCVSNFDHHCGVFGRCIAGVGLTGNMGFFIGIILLGLAGGLTCFASVFLGLIYQEDGFLLSVIMLAYFTPMILDAAYVDQGSMLWPELLDETCARRARDLPHALPKPQRLERLAIGRVTFEDLVCPVPQVRVEQMKDEVLQLREERDVPCKKYLWSSCKIGTFFERFRYKKAFRHAMEYGKNFRSGTSSSAENTRLMQAHEGVTGEAASLRQELKAVLEERALLRSSIDALKAGNAQLQHSVRGLETSLATVRGDLEQRINKHGAMEEHIASLRKQLESVLAEKVKAEGLISSQHVEILSLHKLRDEFLAEKANGQALVQKLEASEAELSRSKKDKAALDQLVSSLHVDCAQMRTQRDSALAEVPHLKSSIQQQDVLMKDLESQVTALQQQLQSSKDTSGRVDQQAKHLVFALERSREDGARHEQAALALRVERTRLLEALERLRRGKAQQREIQISQEDGSGSG
ncbi:Hip14 [Symbiodinium sp. CCMP2456]|nr:Hip14 [Symbiodinium sp. CCMP2456]